jgi:HEAT repeat protein
LGLAFCEKPPCAASGILQSISSEADPDLSESALLTLGVVASRPGTEAGESLRFLLEKLKVARDSREKTLALEALGNSESEAALEAVARTAEDEDETVRACAVHAMRAMPGADAVLRRKAETDSSERVRAIAVERIAARASLDPEVREWLERVSRSDPSPRVRESALQVCADLERSRTPR